MLGIRVDGIGGGPRRSVLIVVFVYAMLYGTSEELENRLELLKDIYI